MNPTYLDRDGDQWFWDANHEGYYTKDMDSVLSLEGVRDKFGPLKVWDEGSKKFVQEPENQEQLFRRIVREELDRRFGRVHT